MIENAPNISVVIVTYNFEKYLAECIESILAQTLKPAEIIITDDCSMDRTWQIIDSYAKKYPHLIRPFRQSQNVGPCDNGTFGCKMARGNLMCALDGDDRWHPRKLELEWKALQNNPKAKIAYSNVRTIDEQGNPVDLWVKPGDPPPPTGDVFVQVFSKNFFRGRLSIFRNELIYRNIYDEFVHDKNVPVHLDWDFKIRITSKYQVAYSGEALVDYRIIENGFHRTQSHKLLESAQYVVRKNMRLVESRTPGEINKIKNGIQNLLHHLEGKFQKHGGVQQTCNKTALPAVLVNSLPKAGTNLLTKLLVLIPGLTERRVHLGHVTLGQYAVENIDDDHGVPIGVDFPKMVPRSRIQQILKSLSGGTFGSAHIPYSKALSQMIWETGIKMLLMLRDPRDVVVSHANYIFNSPAHPLCRAYQAMSIEQRIMTSICGTQGNSDLQLQLLNIYDRIQSILPWMTQSFVCTTKFENIVGPKGGGSIRQQFGALKRICDHIGVHISNPEIQWIGEQLFGGTATFNKGTIGAWKECFSQKHKEVFHEIAGELLIEMGYEADRSWVDGNRHLEHSKCPSAKKGGNIKNNNLGKNLIFLISQPRAGSTLLQRILSGHPDIFTTAEPWIMLHPIYALKDEGVFTEFNHQLARQGLEDFTSQVPEGKELYFNALRQMGNTLYHRMLELSGKRIFLDKTPRYYYVITELKRIYPHAKFVILLRNPMDVLSSTLKTWFQNDPGMLQKSTNYLDVIKAPTYLIQGLQYLKEEAIVIRYEDLVADTEQQIKGLCERLGLSFKQDMLSYGAHPKPKGRFGDAIGIGKHEEAVPYYVNKWVANLTTPTLYEFSQKYIGTLGPEVFNSMGYSYEKIKEQLTALRAKVSCDPVQPNEVSHQSVATILKPS